MASSQVMNTTNQYIKYQIEATQNSQNINNNTSNVTVKVKVYRTNSGYPTYGNGTIYVTINGTQYTATITNSQVIDSTPIYVFTKTLDIPHNADGSKTLNMSARFYLDYGTICDSVVQSWSMSLTTIPRASSFTLSSNNVYAGTTITGTITRATSSFTHKVYLNYGTQSHLVGTGIGTNFSFTVPMECCNMTPNATIGQGGFHVETYNGSTFVGKKSLSFYVKVPEDILPTFESVSIERIDNEVPPSWKTYVRGYSQAKFTINNASSLYGATIKSYTITGQDINYSGAKNVVATNKLTKKGEFTYTATVTDSRGRTHSKTATINVVDYEPPRINNFTVKRVNQDKIEDDEGRYLLCRVSYTISSVGGKNSVTKSEIGWRRIDNSTYTYSGIKFNSDQDFVVGSGNVSPDYEYMVIWNFADALTSSSRTIKIPTALCVFDFYQNGKGIAVGKVAKSEGFEIDWDSSFNKNVDIKGILSVNGTEVSIISIKEKDGQTSIKYSNGVMINHYMYTTPSVNVTNVWGTLYGCGQKNDLPNYIETFTQPPTVSMTVCGNSGYSAMLNKHNSPTTTHAGSYEVVRGTSASNLTFIISVISIGRWK